MSFVKNTLPQGWAKVETHPHFVFHATPISTTASFTVSSPCSEYVARALTFGPAPPLPV